MLDKWLIDIALKGFPKCHKRVLILWHCLTGIFTALSVALVDCMYCLMADENANSAGRNLHLDFRGIDCQGT
jgi:hypothetical protein